MTPCKKHQACSVGHPTKGLLHNAPEAAGHWRSNPMKCVCVFVYGCECVHVCVQMCSCMCRALCPNAEAKMSVRVPYRSLSGRLSP